MTEGLQAAAVHLRKGTRQNGKRSIRFSPRKNNNVAIDLFYAPVNVGLKERFVFVPGSKVRHGDTRCVALLYFLCLVAAIKCDAGLSETFQFGDSAHRVFGIKYRTARNKHISSSRNNWSGIVKS